MIRLAALFSSKQTDLYHTLVENKPCLEEHKRVDHTRNIPRYKPTVLLHSKESNLYCVVHTL